MSTRSSGRATVPARSCMGQVLHLEPDNAGPRWLRSSHVRVKRGSIHDQNLVRLWAWRNHDPSPRRRLALRGARLRAQAASRPTAAVLIVAHNQARRIAATVRASRAIPGVDLVLVVDDGSADNTQHLARKAGAVVVRHSHQRGRSVSIETGAAVVGMRDEQGKPPRAVLLMEPGLGNAAIGAAPLVAAVLESVADMAIGLTDGGSRSTGASAGSARRAISSLSGWSPIQPLSRVRC